MLLQKKIADSITVFTVDPYAECGAPSDAVGAGAAHEVAVVAQAVRSARCASPDAALCGHAGVLRRVHVAPGHEGACGLVERRRAPDGQVVCEIGRLRPHGGYARQ